MAEISVALGGGGVKGIAHLGVLKQLQKEGFRIKAVAGTSVGGIIGSVFAANIPFPTIESEITQINQRNFFSRLQSDGPSLLGLTGLVNILTKYLSDLTFEDLSIPFAVTAVDIDSNQEFIIHQGKLLDAVLATVAIPGIFPPRKIGAHRLVDGGVVDPVPVAVARWLAPKLPVVAVCLSPVPEQWSTLPQIHVPFDTPIPAPILEQISRTRISQSIRLFVQSVDITTRMIAELRMRVERPDVILRPDVHHIGILDRTNPLDAIAAGEQEVIDSLPRIRQAMSWYHQLTRQFQSAPPPGQLLEKDGHDLA